LPDYNNLKKKAGMEEEWISPVSNCFLISIWLDRFYRLFLFTVYITIFFKANQELV